MTQPPATLHRYGLGDTDPPLEGLHLVFGSANSGKTRLAARVAHWHLNNPTGTTPLWIVRSKLGRYDDFDPYEDCDPQSTWMDTWAALDTLYAMLRIDAGPLLVVVDEADEKLFQRCATQLNYAADFGRSQQVGLLVLTQNPAWVPTRLVVNASTATYLPAGSDPRLGEPTTR